MKTFALVSCLGLIVAGAVGHGAITHRWGSPDLSGSRAAALHAHTLQLPEYRSEEVPSEIEVKEKSSVTCKRYVSTVLGTGGVVSVTTGPAGAVSTHTPDVCYPASGYTTVVAPKRDTIDLPDGTTVTCYVAEFEKVSASRAERQKVRWAWATPGGTGWTAPDQPRIEYLRESELYKLYVVTPVPVTDERKPAEESAAARTFVEQSFLQYSKILLLN